MLYQRLYSMHKGIANLVSTYKSKPETVKGPRIKVESMTAKVSFAYEKLRNALDYKEDNLLRISALERILKRRLQSPQTTIKTAKALIEELIRGKYLPNDTLPETKIGEVSEIINKYLTLQKQAIKKYPELETQGDQLFSWYFEIAAREIDEALVSKVKEKALVDAFYQVVSKDLQFEYAVSDDDKKVQMYVATNKAFMKWDQTTIEYLLIRYFYPHWIYEPDKVMKDMVNHVRQIRESVQAVYFHPLNELLAKKMKRHVVVFDVMRDILEHNPEDAEALFSDEEKLSQTIKSFATKKYGDAKKKLRRSVFNAVIYILITKSIFAFVVEYPIDLWLEGHVNTFALTFNIILPPLIMFLLAFRIRVPKDDNTAKIIEYTNNIVAKRESPELVSHIKQPQKRSVFAKILFWILYLALYVVTFGAISNVLTEYLSFNYVSVALFIFFLSLVVFFFIRISRSARELNVLKKKEPFLGLLLSLFILPIVRFGHWTSLHLGKINIFVYILDFIIEAPFKKLIEFFEEWLGFLREKKEEVY